MAPRTGTGTDRYFAPLGLIGAVVTVSIRLEAAPRTMPGVGSAPITFNRLALLALLARFLLWIDEVVSGVRPDDCTGGKGFPYLDL